MQVLVFMFNKLKSNLKLRQCHLTFLRLLQRFHFFLRDLRDPFLEHVLRLEDHRTRKAIT